MGFKNWLARMGNVGGIARNVADGWKKTESQNPNMPPREIAENYVKVRFGLINDSEVRTALRDISTATIGTPLQLAWALLKSENPDEPEVLIQNHDEWIQIMREGMKKKGLNPDLEF